MVRTSKGKAFGCLVGGWAEPWRLYPADAGEGAAPARMAWRPAGHLLSPLLRLGDGLDCFGTPRTIGAAFGRDAED